MGAMCEMRGVGRSVATGGEDANHAYIINHAKHEEGGRGRVFFFKIARQVCFGAGVATNDGIYDQKV